MTTLAHSYTIKLKVGNKPEQLNPYRDAISKLENPDNKKNDSGFDLYVPQSVTIEPGEIKLINMGVKCAVTKNTEPSPYYLYARSSVSKRGIILANSVGIIDSGYRGPLMAAFYNTTDNDVIIPEGDRIVQICMPDLSYDFGVSVVDSLDETERGEGGLGSTGH
jgi:dUTP pyrophosphatase